MFDLRENYEFTEKIGFFVGGILWFVWMILDDTEFHAWIFGTIDPFMLLLFMWIAIYISYKSSQFYLKWKSYKKMSEDWAGTITTIDPVATTNTEHFNGKLRLMEMGARRHGGMSKPSLPGISRMKYSIDPKKWTKRLGGVVI